MLLPREADWEITWVPRSGGRKPEVPPSPAFPNGKHLVALPQPDAPSCRGELPYVMWQEDGTGRGLGLLMITCRRCGMRSAVTTAGRPDDPISLTQNCGG